MTSPATAPEVHGASDSRPEMDDRPPVLGSWRNIYAFVLVTLVVLAFAMWALGKAYT